MSTSTLNPWTAPPIPNVDRDSLETFFNHVTDQMHVWQGMLGNTVFAVEETRGMHPSLLRDLQPYEGHQMAASLIEVTNRYLNVDPFLRFIRRRRVNKLRRNLVGAASELSLVTKIRLSPGQHDHSVRDAMRGGLGKIMAAAEFSASGLHATADLDATQIIDFIYLPEDSQAAIEDILNGYYLVTKNQLQWFTQAFDQFYENLRKITLTAYSMPVIRVNQREKKVES